MGVLTNKLMSISAVQVESGAAENSNQVSQSCLVTRLTLYHGLLTLFKQVVCKAGTSQLTHLNEQ